MYNKTTGRLSLAFAFLLGTLATHPGQVAAQSGKSLYSFPLGVQMYTYRHQMPTDVAGTLDLIKSLGITEIEGGVPKGMTADEFKKLLADRGLKITSTGAGYEQIVKDPEAVVKQAKDLGVSFVMVAWIPHDKSGFTLENAQKAVADFNRVGKVLADNGITLCYHDHGYEFVPYQDGTLLDYMIKNTNPKYVSFEMDVLWTTHGGGDPVALLKKYGSRWKLMHLKDLRKGVKGDLSGGTPAENDVVLGEGQVNWPAVLTEAKKAGIKHYYIEDESDHEIKNVPLSIAYLKNLTK